MAYDPCCFSNITFTRTLTPLEEFERIEKQRAEQYRRWFAEGERLYAVSLPFGYDKQPTIFVQKLFDDERCGPCLALGRSAVMVKTLPKNLGWLTLRLLASELDRWQKRTREEERLATIRDGRCPECYRGVDEGVGFWMQVPIGGPVETRVRCPQHGEFLDYQD